MTWSLRLCIVAIMLVPIAYVSGATPPSTLNLKVTYYDFHENGTSPEFEMPMDSFAFGTKDLGLVDDTLDKERKPVRNRAISPALKYQVQNIGRWFREWHSGDKYYYVGDTVLTPKDSVCVLFDDFCIWSYTAYDSIFHPEGFYACDSCYKNIKVNDSLKFVLRPKTVGGTTYNFYTLETNANNVTNFFPLDGKGFESSGRPHFFDSLGHNYSFTMEMHYTFVYHGGEVLKVAGDDDIYVYINNHLIIDLGGIHNSLSDSISLDGLGLTAGTSYNFDFFFAERHTTGSHLTINTTMDFQQPITLGAHENLGMRNPVKKIISFGKGMAIDVPRATSTITVSVVDAAGHCVVSQKSIAVGNSVPDLKIPAGVYFVKAVCKDKNATVLSTLVNKVVSFR